MSSDNKQLRTSIESMFSALKEKLDGLFGTTETHYARTDNPHLVTKAQVGLSELPNAVTSSRALNSDTALLTAKGMRDHAIGGDHDTRYYTQALVDQALSLKLDIADVIDNLTSNTGNQALSANQGRVLKDAVDAINALISSDDTTLDELQEIVNFIKANKATLDNLTISNIAGLQVALNDKVDKVTGKQLSTEDFTTALLNKLNGIQAGAQVNVATNLSASATATEYTILNDNGTGFALAIATALEVGLMSPAQFTKLNGVEAGAQVNPGTTDARANSSTTLVLQAKAMRDHGLSGDHDARYHTKTFLDGALNDKVDKVTGKQLSTEDFTSAEKTKLSGVQAGAQVNVATNLSLGGSGNNRTLNSSTGSNVALVLASSTTAGLLSTSMYDKLVGISPGAEPNVATNLDRTLSTTSITITNTNGTNAILPSATPSTAGLQSSADKSKLNGIEVGAQVNVDTDLNITGTGDARTLTSSTGSNVALPVGTTTNAGLMSISDKSKLDGIGDGAEANVATNLGISRAVASVTITSSTGADVTIGSATADLAGSMSAGDKSKLNGIQSGAQVNVGTNLGISQGISSVTLTSNTGTDVTLGSASPTLAGIMTSADKSKLNGIQPGADVNPATTASRADASTTTVLQAKAMADHVGSGDHDAEYVTKLGNSTINGDLTANDFIYASDESLKEDIEFVGPVSDKLRQLLSKQYRFKDDPERKLRFGYLAHEAGAVFPELLRTREDGKKALAYVDLIPLLTEGFKEKCNELDEVRSEMAQMRGEMDQLRKLVNDRLS